MKKILLFIAMFFASSACDNTIINNFGDLQGLLDDLGDLTELDADIVEVTVEGSPANRKAEILVGVDVEATTAATLSYAWSVPEGWSIVGAANEASATIQAADAYGAS